MWMAAKLREQPFSVDIASLDDGDGISQLRPEDNCQKQCLVTNVMSFEMFYSGLQALCGGETREGPYIIYNEGTC